MPEPFRSLTAVAAPLPLVNVDTDMIWPAGKSVTLLKGAQAGNAFRRLRFLDDTDQENPEFILNRKPWRGARILVAGDNFGCGSSRELAVWTLYEWGLRCVIAPSFGDIFYANACLTACFPCACPYRRRTSCWRASPTRRRPKRPSISRPARCAPDRLSSPSKWTNGAGRACCRDWTRSA